MLVTIPGMGQALYRKYRSKALAEIVGQEHITKALTKALATNRISHAYLFTGPRGIGKTSIARILAFEVNGLPYDETATHLDIIEIDAASNRRIDEVRDLRDKVHIAPTSASYKVYIIDEVHMLTREAFNALLKTLEEPPAHVIFILATTEVHKLPETIISRTQHFTFKPIDEENVVKHLKSIAKAEKITIDDEAVRLIAKHGEGSFRDSISMLDQIQHTAAKITVHDVEAMLGIAPKEAVKKLWSFIDEADAKNLIITLQALHNQGISPVILAKQLSAVIRTDLISGASTTPARDLGLLEKLIEISGSADPSAALEVTLLHVVFADTARVIPSDQQSAPPTKEIKVVEKKAMPTTTKKPIDSKNRLSLADTEKPLKPKSHRDHPSSINATIWPEVLTSIKQRYNTLYGVLRMAQPEFEGQTVTLTLKFTFHQKRLNEPKNKQLIADAVAQVCGVNPEIICVINETQPAVPSQQAKETLQIPQPTGPLGTISNIFGGAELLES